jgi:thiamine-phosphate pyrophosphorylase
LRSLSDCLLYGILDLSYVETSDAPQIAKAMIEGGIDLIQLRGKARLLSELVDLAGKLHQITSEARIPLIANDHVEIAQQVPLEGVHVGQEDDSVASVREKAGRHLLVGRSTHSVDQALAAQDEGADYIGFGPIFATPTKPDYKPIGLENLSEVHAKVSVPIFCIGGIKIDNLKEVIAAGAQRVAIVSGLLKAPDIAQYAREAKQMLRSSFVIRHSR